MTNEDKKKERKVRHSAVYKEKWIWNFVVHGHRNSVLVCR